MSSFSDTIDGLDYCINAKVSVAAIVIRVTCVFLEPVVKHVLKPDITLEQRVAIKDLKSTVVKATENMSSGDFSSLGIESYQAEMLSDAYKAITLCELWDYMKSYSPPEEQGFMFSQPSPEIARINQAMKYDGHSGSSYGYTMRVMEFIAKNGWNAYTKRG